MSLLNLIKVARFIIHFLKYQNKFNEQFIDSYLQPFYKQYNKEFKESTLHRIKKYYCLGQPLTSAGYKYIYGKKLSEKERELAILMGILTPLIDDFTDEKILSSEAIDQLIFSPADYKSETLEEAVAKTISCYLLGNVKSTEGFLYVGKQTMQAQHWSQKQMDPGVSRNELYNIALEKGGWSQILAHYIIDEVPTQQTIDTLYLLGGIMQMCSDIFDVYKDFKEGIATYANTCDNYKIFEISYTKECRNFVKAARALPYKKDDINNFITLFVFIMARGIVALRMLDKLQKQLGGGVLPFAQLDRKQLICDMEKPINIFKTAWFAYTIPLKKSPVHNI